jgi:hypothetical protein
MWDSGGLFSAQAPGLRMQLHRRSPIRDDAPPATVAGFFLAFRLFLRHAVPRPFFKR